MFFPAVAVAVPFAGKDKVPRTFAVPLTSKVAVGVVMFTPIFAVAPIPVWARAEFWMLVAVVNSGRTFTVPPLVVTLDVTGGASLAAFVTDDEFALAVPDPGLTLPASMNADAGRPPSVCASAAFKAY